MMTHTMRRSATLAAKVAPPKTAPSNDEINKEEDDDTLSKTFAFNSQSFATYQEMVNVKWQHNLDMLKSSGLLDAKKAVDSTSVATTVNAATARARGLKRTTVNIICHHTKRRKIEDNTIIVVSGEDALLVTMLEILLVARGVIIFVTRNVLI